MREALEEGLVAFPRLTASNAVEFLFLACLEGIDVPLVLELMLCQLCFKFLRWDPIKVSSILIRVWFDFLKHLRHVSL